MKIIDLLNKIAKGEASDLTTKFIFNNEEYSFYSLDHSDYCLDNFLLNQEIEIIEEDKKIKQITIDDELVDEKAVLDNIGLQRNLIKLTNKINEIIDVVNKLKEEEKC